jgi:hypothetical protein
MPMRIRAGNLRSASVIIRRELAAIRSLYVPGWRMPERDEFRKEAPATFCLIRQARCGCYIHAMLRKGGTKAEVAVAASVTVALLDCFAVAIIVG